MIFNGSVLFGPSIGGMLIPYIDTQGCFFAAVIGNLVVLVSIFTMRISESAPPHESEQSISRYAGRYNSGMDEGALSTVVYTFGNSNFLH
jgi:hypothetical protein